MKDRANPNISPKVEMTKFPTLAIKLGSVEKTNYNTPTFIPPVPLFNW